MPEKLPDPPCTECSWVWHTEEKRWICQMEDPFCKIHGEYPGKLKGYGSWKGTPLSSFNKEELCKLVALLQRFHKNELDEAHRARDYWMDACKPRHEMEGLGMPPNWMLIGMGIIVFAGLLVGFVLPAFEYWFHK